MIGNFYNFLPFKISSKRINLQLILKMVAQIISTAIPSRATIPILCHGLSACTLNSWILVRGKETSNFVRSYHKKKESQKNGQPMATSKS